MWLITNFGFFSIVQKSSDEGQGTLTVRSRVKSDLEMLKARYLPGMQEISANASHDYKYRAKVSRAELAQALGQIALDIDYDNFKNSVAEQQGGTRAHLYGDVWSTLYRLQSGQYEEPGE